MSDRSYFTLIVYAPGSADAAGWDAFLNDPAGEGLEFGGANEEPEEGELLPWRWGYDQMALDSATENGPALAERFPDASFECWVDPKYEYPGELYAHTPELGTFVGICDAEGEPYATAQDVLNAPNLEALRDLVGAAWQARFQELRDAVPAASAAALAADG